MTQDFETEQRGIVRERSVQAFKKAIDIVGSQAEMARLLEIAPELLNRWLKHSKYGVSPRYVLPIELITKGRISRYDLRCDLYKIDD